MVKITKRSVEAAARTGKEYFLWDDELEGSKNPLVLRSSV
ncbi:hypothetical protein KOXY103107_16300 [Komagataeibacter xylinus]